MKWPSVAEIVTDDSSPWCEKTRSSTCKFADVYLAKFKFADVHQAKIAKLIDPPYEICETERRIDRAGWFFGAHTGSFLFPSSLIPCSKHSLPKQPASSAAQADFYFANKPILKVLL